MLPLLSLFFVLLSREMSKERDGFKNSLFAIFAVTGFPSFFSKIFTLPGFAQSLG
jgi:hypothetical protein